MADFEKGLATFANWFFKAGRWLAGIGSAGLSEIPINLLEASANQKRINEKYSPDSSDFDSISDGSNVNSAKAQQGIGLDYVYDGSHLANDVTGLTESLRASSAQDYAAYIRGLDVLQRQQDYSREMSNTAIQRQVADAEAAGVNPYYLFGGGNSGSGVSVPAGASGVTSDLSAASSASAVASAVSSVSGIVSSLLRLAAK